MEFILQNLILVVGTVLSGGALIYLSIRQPGGRNQLTPTQATLLINREDAQVVDVRETDEYVAGHLPDARNIPLGSLDERVGELEKFKKTPLILVCQTGTRSGTACKKLQRLGFEKVQNLDGGIKAWAEAGLPLKKGAKK